MRRLSLGDSRNWTDVTFLLVFGVAFGYVEAAVVKYLRGLLKFRTNVALAHYHVWLNLGFLTFVRPAHSVVKGSLGSIETAREAATIVMLVAISWLAAKRPLQRLAAFMITFATWDLSYYGWLRVIDHWPLSFFTHDIFFLIPVTWIGPVLTPLIICTVMLIVGLWLYVREFTSSRGW